MIFARRVPVFLLIGLLAIPALAQTTATWTGLGPVDGNGNASFGDAANWAGNVAPVNGDNLLFGPAPHSHIELIAPFTAGDITFGGIQDGYYLSGGTTLTINGNVATNTGARYWGLFDTYLEVSLGSGLHTYTTGANADIYHFGLVSGLGGIVKEGANTLYFTQSNTYSGGTTVNTGTVAVGTSHALGYGTVTLASGTLLKTAYVSEDITLSNDFVFGANVNLSTAEFFNDQPTVTLTLGNGDGSTIKPVTGVTDVQLNLTGPKALYLAGDMLDGSGATTYTFSAPGSSRPSYILSGFNIYTGGTVVTSGAAVTFNGIYTVPETGVISVRSDAYAGFNEYGVAASDFPTHFNPTTSTGTIGFDGDNTFSGNIDLSSFTANGGEISLGTLSRATLTGTITPPTGSAEYRFRSSGTLFLEGPLTGSNDILSYSFDQRAPGLLVLHPFPANDYTGTTRALGAGIIFDSIAALSGSTSLSLEYGGYIGITDTSGLTLDDLVSQGVSVNSGGVLGLDSHDILAGDGSTYLYSGPINFGSLTTPVYLGTASGAEISGTITTTNGGNDDYYFTGYNGASLTVTTPLTGTKQVHIGLPGVFQERNVNVSAVELLNTANNFTGGIVLNSGQLTAVDPLSLGTGSLTVDASASDGRAYLQTQGTMANAINLQNGILDIYASGPLTLSGNITGGGGVATTFGSTFTISGNNSYSGGSSFSATPVTVTSDTGLGTGSLSLTEGAQVTFTSAAPTIGSLLQGDSGQEGQAAIQLTHAGNAVLTINQDEDGSFNGAIVESGGASASVVKDGSATLSIYGNLNGNDTPYSGGTTINSGKLYAGKDGALGTGTITINGGSLATDPNVVLQNAIAFGPAGGRLEGNSTFNSAINAGMNVVLAPGNSPGTLTFAAGLSLDSGGSVDFQVQSANGPAGTGYDLLSVTGGATYVTSTNVSPFTIRVLSLDGSGSTGNVADFLSSNGYSWMLLVGNSGGGLSGFDADAFVIDASGFTNGLNGGYFTLTEGLYGSDPAIYLNFSPVPEPSTYLLMGAGLAAIVLNARRRRRS